MKDLSYSSSPMGGSSLLSSAGTATVRYQRAAQRSLQPNLMEELSFAARAHGITDDRLYLAQELMGFAWTLSAKEQRSFGILVLALFVCAREGSARLPLTGGKTGFLGRLVHSLLAHSPTGPGVADVLQDIRKLTGSFTLDRLIGRPGEFRPIIVHRDCVYLHRFFRAEQELIGELRARLEFVSVESPSEKQMDETLNALVEAGTIRISQQQRRAIHVAICRPLSVITGGPGTGKTAVVRSIVLVLEKLGVSLQRVFLTGPTGKAVYRLNQSLENVAHTPGLPKARTLHRLLGASTSGKRFIYNEHNPLAADYVVLDEASMVDLVLMVRLMRSLRKSARLVLVGDAQQLPSVDAGSVLRDLVAVQQQREADVSFVARLTASYRMNKDDPNGAAILSFAGAVRRNDQKRLFSESGVTCVRQPEALTFAGVELLDADSSVAIDPFLQVWYTRYIAPDAFMNKLSEKVYRTKNGVFSTQDQQDLSTLLSHQEKSRLLTVTRQHSCGSDTINRLLHGKVLAESTLAGVPDFYPGEPVVMTRNDYRRGLYNGDSGIVVRVCENDLAHQFRAVFRGRKGFESFPIDVLRSHLQLAYAMTVHRAQGSEFNSVALILPTADVPMFTRELLYTGITRAKSSVTIVGCSSVLRAGSAKTVERFSGVVEALTSFP